jgi:hypothetical protein
MSCADMRPHFAWLLLLLAGCRHPAPAPADAAIATTTTAAPSAVPSSSATPYVDVTALDACTLTYQCGLSHPGLGTTSDATALRFATCDKTVSSYRGPWRDAPPSSKAVKESKRVTKIASPTCKRLREMTAAITPADVAAAQESAIMDSTACGLSLDCADDAGRRFDVQRQSLSGPLRVVRLVVALQAAK